MMTTQMAMAWARTCQDAGHLISFDLLPDGEGESLLCSDCADAFARRQMAAEYCQAHGSNWPHQGCKVCDTIFHWEKQFDSIADEHDKCDEKAKQQVEAFRERAAQLCDVQETGDGVDTGRMWRNTMRRELAAAIRAMEKPNG